MNPPEGKSVEKDLKKAFGYWLEGAKSGSVKARANLATLYFKGEGTDKSYKEAYAWASLASYQDNTSAKALIQKVIPMLSDRESADALAFRYFKKYGVDKSKEE